MLLPTFTCVWGGIFYYAHLRPNFMLYTYLYSFEKQLRIQGKGRNLYYLFIFWKAISCHMFPFWETFSCHIQHICTLAKHLTTYPTCTLRLKGACLLLPILIYTYTCWTSKGLEKKHNANRVETREKEKGKRKVQEEIRYKIALISSFALLCIFVWKLVEE